MRLLNTDEKKIIEIMYKEQNSSRFIYNCINEYLDNEELKINKSKKKLSIVTINDTQDIETIDTRILKIEKYIVVLISLIKVFEREGYIYLYKRINTSNTDESIGICSGENTIEKILQDERLYNLVVTYLDYSVITTPSLDDLRLNKYISLEDRKYNKSHKLTVFALISSILIGITGIVISLIPLITEYIWYSVTPNA